MILSTYIRLNRMAINKLLVQMIQLHKLNRATDRDASTISFAFWQDLKQKMATALESKPKYRVATWIKMNLDHW